MLFYQEAIAAESFIESTPMCIEKGELERGFADSDHVLQGEMRMGGQVCDTFWLPRDILSSPRILSSHLSQSETSHLPRLKEDKLSLIYRVINVIYINVN